MGEAVKSFTKIVKLKRCWKRKTKGSSSSLPAEAVVPSDDEDSTTDVEEVAMNNSKRGRNKKGKSRRVASSLSLPSKHDTGDTDVEYLSGDIQIADESDEMDENIYGLDAPELDTGEITDLDQLEASDNEDVFQTKPVKKEKVYKMPEPFQKEINIKETD